MWKSQWKRSAEKNLDGLLLETDWNLGPIIDKGYLQCKTTFREASRDVQWEV